MQLLVITNNPNRASFRQRIGIYLDLLGSKGIDSQVATLPASALGRHRLFASAKSADGILLHRKTLSAWDAYCLRGCGGKVIYDFDDAIMYSDRQSGRDSHIRSHRFGRSIALSSLVLAGNDYLAERARHYNANVHIVPTGVDVSAYRGKAQRKDDGVVRLAWIGSRSTLPYLREIRPALEGLGRRYSNVVLRIICDAFFDLESLRVEKRAWSKNTEAADLAACDIGLAPLPDDRFTRGKCGYKILQYQAAGLPVVASPVGVNAQYVREGVTGFLARDASQWIDRVAALIENPGLRTALGHAGQGEVERFDVSVIGERLCRLIMEYLEQRNDGARPC